MSFRADQKSFEDVLRMIELFGITHQKFNHLRKRSELCQHNCDNACSLPVGVPIIIWPMDRPFDIWSQMGQSISVDAFDTVVANGGWRQFR